MTELAPKALPSMQPYARFGGLLYVLIIVIGIAGEFFFRGKLLVAGNAAVTAANIETSPLLWRMGIVAEYIMIIFATVLAMIYFFLMRPVHPRLNLLATFFRMVSITVQVVAILNLMNVLFYLDPSQAAGPFSPAQRSALSGISIRSHSFGYGVSLLFLGCCFLVHGYLVYRSGFLPKTLGILIQVSGACYIANGFILILAPTAAKLVLQLFFLPVFVAETSLGLWLLIKGIDEEKWKARHAE